MLYARRSGTCCGTATDGPTPGTLDQMSTLGPTTPQPHRLLVVGPPTMTGTHGSSRLSGSGAMMHELTFHIGLPKTGTTALQKHVFPFIPGYVGKFYGKHRTVAGRYSFHREAWRRSRGSADWRRELESWLSRIRVVGVDSVFFSDELLAAWPDGRTDPRWPFIDGWQAGGRSRPHPIVDFLQHARAEVGSATRVRAIVSLRNQVDFIGSLYSQVQPAMEAPSQGHFESQVRALLDNGDPFCDWASLVEELESVLVEQDLLVLLYEDGLDANVRRIAEFMNLDPKTLPTAAPRENVKGSGTGSWQYRAELPLLKRGWFGRIRKTVDNAVSRVGGRQRGLRTVLAAVDSAFSRISAPRTVLGVVISVPEGLASDVRAHFATSNSRLAARLGRELSGMGY